MKNNKTFLAVIPARGGSKGLPGKNIRPLEGKPLIGWSVEAAKQSRYVDECIITTDSQEIADAASQYGAKVPFMRPDELSTDTAKMLDVLTHVYEWSKDQNTMYDYLVLLQPTSPFRTASHIDEAIDLLFAKQGQCVLGVTELEHSPLLSNTLPDDLNMNNFYGKELQNLNRQEMKQYFRLNGAIYVIEWDYLIKNRKWIGEGTYAYVMNRASSVDIDCLEDFLFAQALLDNNAVQLD